MILLVKLITGETLVGDFINSPTPYGKETISITGTARLITNDPTNIGIVPYILGGDIKEDTDIPEAIIVAVTKPFIELENEYRRQFGSGIELTSTMPIH